MKHRVRAAMAWVMSCLMTFAMVPTAALADGGAPTRPETIDVSPYTYVNKQGLIGDNFELTIGNLSNIVNDLSKDWGPIAGAIYSDNSWITVDSRKDRGKWDDIYGPEVTNGARDNDSGGYCFDVIDNLSGANSKSGQDRYNTDGEIRAGDRKDLLYMTSGLQYATNLNDILLEMCNMSSIALRKTKGNNETADNELSSAIYEGIGDHLSALKSTASQGAGAPSTDTKAFYRIVTSAFRKDDKRFYNNYALIFYDFSLAPILVNGVKAWDVTPDETYDNDESGNTAQTSFFENKSKSDSEVSAEVSSETQESVTNSMETTKSFSFTTELGIETKYGMEDLFDFLNVEQTISTKFTQEEAMETAWGKETSVSNTIGGSSSATITLPPHTCIALEQTTGKMNKTYTYKCPVALNYKVAVVSLSGKFDEDYDIADYVKSFCTVFGCGDLEGGMYAPQNLYVRSNESGMDAPFGQVDGWYKENHVTKLNWDNIKAAHADTQDHIVEASTKLPMFTAGASLTVAQSSKNTELGDIQPLYRLTKIELAEGNKNNVMTVGETLDMSSYAVNGFNDKGVAYYGFDPNDGEWVLCNEDGDEIESSDLAELVADKATGTLELAANKPGTVYLTWVLSDTASYTAKGDVAVTKADDTPTPTYPKIKVTINEAPVDLTGYRIEAEGEPEVFVNKTLKLSNELSAKVYDNTDAVVTDQVEYQLQDSTLPASITNGEFVATKAGDYKVRATYSVANPKQTIYSDYLTVHVYSLTKHDAVPATCTEDGTIAYWECDQTGKLYSDEDGTTEIAAEDTVEKALGHELEHVDAADATCTKGGNIEHYLCKRCGKFFADEQAATELGEGDVIFTDALGHDWDEGVVDPGAGCVTTGTKTYTCQREGCGITKAEGVAALGHSWGDWIESRPATDTEDGEEKRMCIYCSEEETRTIPADNHVHDLSKVDAVAPSCVTDGNIDYWLCSRCNNIYADDAAQTQVNKGDEVLRATGHAWDEGTVTTDPTCTGTGIRTLTCTNQGCTATKEVEEPAHGHDMENAIESVLTEPTCTTPGRKKLACAYKDSESCTYYKTEAIDALDHAWDEGKVTTKPTCTMKGTKTYTCTREGCGQTKTEDIPAIKHEWGEWTNLNAEQHQRVCTHDAKHIEQADHKWGEGVVNKEATVKSKGTKTYTCADCGATKSESIPKVIIEGTLLNTMKAKGKTAMVISWNKIDDADGYDVYLAPCNTKSKTYKLEVVESNEGGTTRKSTIKDLKKNICYKAQVKAFVYVNGKKTYVKNGAVVHCLTSGGTEKVTNPKSIKVKKSKVTLKKGKSTQIKATVVKKDDSKRLLKDGHVSNLRYVSGNKKVATVSKSGRILAKGKGTCKVYVIASNGVKKAITVKVK